MLRERVGEDGVNWPFFFTKRYISKLKTYFCTLSTLAGVAYIILCWDVNLKWWDKCLYSNFDLLKRSVVRPNSPTSGVIWPGEWGYLADLLFWGRKLMLWASKLPRQQWRLFCTHFVGLTPCWIHFRTFWLRQVWINLTFQWPALTSISLCLILNFALALLFYARRYVFSLGHRICNWWKDIFWKTVGWSIAF